MCSKLMNVSSKLVNVRSKVVNIHPKALNIKMNVRKRINSNEEKQKLRICTTLYRGICKVCSIFAKVNSA